MKFVTVYMQINFLNLFDNLRPGKLAKARIKYKVIEDSAFADLK